MEIFFFKPYRNVYAVQFSQPCLSGTDPLLCASSTYDPTMFYRCFILFCFALFYPLTASRNKEKEHDSTELFDPSPLTSLWPFVFLPFPFSGSFQDLSALDQPPCCVDKRSPKIAPHSLIQMSRACVYIDS